MISEIFSFLKFFYFFLEGVFAPYNCGVVYSPPPLQFWRCVWRVWRCVVCFMLFNVRLILLNVLITKKIQQKKSEKSDKKTVEHKKNKKQIFAANIRYRYNRYKIEDTFLLLHNII